MASWERGLVSRSASQDFHEIQQGHEQDALSGLTAAGDTLAAFLQPVWTSACSAEPVPALLATHGGLDHTVGEDGRAVPEDDGVCGLSTVTPCPAL